MGYYYDPNSFSFVPWNLNDPLSSTNPPQISPPIVHPLVVFSAEDIFLCGLQGIQPTGALYRALRPDENVDGNILSKAIPNFVSVNQPQIAQIAVNQHIHSGHIPSQFISTSLSLEKITEWAYYTMENPKNIQERPTPLQIIQIHISRLPERSVSGMINLTNEQVRNHFVSGDTQINRAKSSQEVLLQWEIPKINLIVKCDEFGQLGLVPEVVFELIDPPKPLWVKTS